MHQTWRPTLDKEEAEKRLELLLVPGSLDSSGIDARIGRLSLSFQRYAASYPLPLWAPGLILTHEMRGLTEALFPMSELRPVFDLVLRKGCRFAPLLSGTWLHTASSWLDLLHKVAPQLPQADPTPLLRELARDGLRRRSFLFALLLPQHFGGAFDRYPSQTGWINSWLRDNRGRLGGKIRALDSACGSGEGTYGLAEAISAAGFRAHGSLVHGSTIEPVELFAAAHAFFPHDPPREREYRARVAPRLTEGAIPMEFHLDEVGRVPDKARYDLVLCNGLLGGPLLHEPAEVERAVGGLAARLAPGGVLLAADRFHAGWRQMVPKEMLLAVMRRHGLEPIDVPEGIGGEKQT